MNSKRLNNLIKEDETLAYQYGKFLELNERLYRLHRNLDSPHAATEYQGIIRQLAALHLWITKRIQKAAQS